MASHWILSIPVQECDPGDFISAFFACLLKAIACESGFYCVFVVRVRASEPYEFDLSVVKIMLPVYFS